MTSEPSLDNEFGVDLRMTNDSIHCIRAGVQVDLCKSHYNII